MNRASGKMGNGFNQAFLYRLFVHLLAFSAASSLWAASPISKAVIPRVESEPKIDGKLDEAAWNTATRLILVENDSGKQTKEAASVRVMVTADALWLGWTMSDRDIQATFVERDSHFWEEEVAEFFVTAGALDRYFELQWNPLGGVFDAIISNRLDSKGKSRGIDGDWSFTAKGMKSAVKVSGTVADSSDVDRSWTVEVKVPFADLGLTAPKPGEQWRANFYRFNRGGGVGVEKQSWSPTLDGSFHQPSRFGILEFR